MSRLLDSRQKWYVGVQPRGFLAVQTWRSDGELPTGYYPGPLPQTCGDTIPELTVLSAEDD